MIVFLQLTTAGSDSGPFSLYSDLDGYIIPFETDVFKSSLEAGYSTTAPDGTQTVKVVSTGACINSTYITLAIPDCDLAGYVEEITTTTTTTTTTYVCPNCVPNNVTIGTQTWTTCNLDVSTYANGDPIDEVTDPTAWATTTEGAWCYYENNSANGPIYGKLYNWYAVNDPRGLAPAGWHVPSIAEFTQLNDYLNAQLPTGNVGGKMKATGTIEGNDGCWSSPNTDATNSSGFKAIPGGLRNENIGDSFFGIDTVLQLWSSTENNINSAKGRTISAYNGNFGSGNFLKFYGFSVRLIQD